MGNKPKLHINATGTRIWHLDGSFHREDGPAVEYANGDKYWFLNDLEYSFHDWINKLSSSDEEKTLLILKYGK